MSRRKLEDKNIRKICQTGGNSYYVTLPVDFVRKLGWQTKQKVELELDEKRGVIKIKDWKK